MISLILLLTAIVLAVLILTHVVAWSWLWVIASIVLAFVWPIFRTWHIAYIYKKKYGYDSSIDALEHFRRDVEARANRRKM